MLLVAASIYGGVLIARDEMGDTEVYHRAAERILAGESPWRLEDDHRFLYAPPWALLFVPLGLLSLFLAKAVWFVANLVFGALLVRRSLDLALPGERAPPGLVALLLLLTFRFFDNNIAHGQLNLLLAWMMLEAAAAFSRGHVARGGMVLGAAILAKVTPVVLLLPLLARGALVPVVATGLGVAVWLAAGGVGWSSRYPAILGDWVNVVVDQATHYDLANKINQSIAAFGYRLFADEAPLLWRAPDLGATLVVSIHALLVGVILLVSLRSRRRGEHFPATGEVELAILYATVVAPYSWKYYFVGVVPALALVLARWRRSPTAAATSFLIAFLVLNQLPGLRLFGRAIATGFQLWSLHLLALLLLFAVAARIALRERSGSVSRRPGNCGPARPGPSVPRSGKAEEPSPS